MLSPRWYLVLRWYLWVAPNVLIGVCVFLFWRRRLYRQLPTFAVYLASQLLEFLTLLSADLLILPAIATMAAFRSMLIVLTGVGAALQIAVLYELAGELLLQRSSLARLLNPLFRWCLAGLLFVAAISSALFREGGIERVVSAFQILDFSANLISIGLLLAVLLLTRALHISWRSLSAGVALGFAVYASAEIASSPWFSVLGKSRYATIDLFRLGGAHVCVLIWLIYIFLPSKPPTFTGHRRDRTDIEAWNHELQKMVR